MSRRASFFARTHPGQRRVRFPDEIVFHESIKESDGEAVIRMLRRVSVDIDINRINMSGMTAIHQVNSPFSSCTFIPDHIIHSHPSVLLHTFFILRGRRRICENPNHGFIYCFSKQKFGTLCKYKFAGII